MWTLNDAILIVQELQPFAHELGYHITLGGGVLNKRESSKDLDLFVLRKNNVERVEAFQVIEAARSWFPGWAHRALRDSPDYGPDADFHFKEAFMFSKGGKRIDLFVQ